MREAKPGTFCLLLRIRITTDVSLKFGQAFCAADDMIEAFPVPDPSARIQDAIELVRAERFPSVKNTGQLMLSDRRDYRMHMVRHHDKFAKLIADSVEVPKAGFHDSFAVWPRQDTLTVTCIKPVIDRLSEALMVFLLLAFSVRLWV